MRNRTAQLVRHLVRDLEASLRDLVIMMADGGIHLAHATMLRWIQRYLPEFEKRWRRNARPIGRSFSMDETYIKGHEQWVYLYGAVGQAARQSISFSAGSGT
jgi:putative transposase